MPLFVCLFDCLFEATSSVLWFFVFVISVWENESILFVHSHFRLLHSPLSSLPLTAYQRSLRPIPIKTTGSEEAQEGISKGSGNLQGYESTILTEE